MKEFIIGEQLRAVLIQYLARHPYAEVAQMIQELSMLQENKKPLSVVEKK